MSNTRREFVLGVTAAIAGVSASAALPFREIGPDGVAAALGRRRAQIHRLYLRFTTRFVEPQQGWSASAAFLMAGDGELLLDRHSYTAVYRRPGAVITERQGEGFYLQGIESDGQPPRLLYQGEPSASRRGRLSLRHFLPAPAERAVGRRDRTIVRGVEAQIFTQDDDRYFVSDDARVLRLERERIEVIDFGEFIATAADVPFPTWIRSQQSGRSPLEMTVAKVLTNDEAMPELQTAFTRS